MVGHEGGAAAAAAADYDDDRNPGQWFKYIMQVMMVRKSQNILSLCMLSLLLMMKIIVTHDGAKLNLARLGFLNSASCLQEYVGLAMSGVRTIHMQVTV